MSRPFFILSCLLLTLLCACSKSNSSQHGIVGQWRLMKSIGTGIIANMQDHRNEMWILDLRPDSSYKKTVEGGFSEYGTYSIANRIGVNGLDTLITFRSNGGGASRESQGFLYRHGWEMYIHFSFVIEDYVKY